MPGPPSELIHMRASIFGPEIFLEIYTQMLDIKYLIFLITLNSCLKLKMLSEPLLVIFILLTYPYPLGSPKPETRKPGMPTKLLPLSPSHINVSPGSLTSTT